MIAGAWIVLFVIASVAFNEWLAGRDNPNRSVDSRLREDGLREVVLEQNRRGHYLAPGTINGTDVVFLLDTGATDISVPAGIAQRLGIQSGVPAQVRTASDIITVYSVVLDRVTIGNITRHRVRAHVNPRMPGDRVLLGMSFLRHLELVQQDGTLTLRQTSN